MVIKDNNISEEIWSTFLSNIKSEGNLCVKCIMDIGHFYLHVEVLKVDEFKNMDVTELSNNEAKNEFFKLLSFPLQGICRHYLKKIMSKNCKICCCRVMKRLGGEWTMNNHHQVDGDKWVCLDHILARDRCIIYSFGIRDDWSFEDQMDLLGGEKDICN